MNVAAIIAEYNPFHKGHQYHIKRTKEITGCSHLLVVMSGYYTQRGEPAIFSPYERAKQALLHGADVVLELPSLFSTASAEGFAFGAISLLHQLGVCHFLSYGSEITNQNLINDIALFLHQEPTEYKDTLQYYLKEGKNFPTARSLALSRFFPDLETMDFSGSNTILALEYHRALHHYHSRIRPVIVERIHNQYNDTSLAEAGKFSSATAIRSYLEHSSTTFSTITEKQPLMQTLQQELSSSLPDSFFYSQEEESHGLFPLFSKDFSLLLQYKLLTQTPETLMEYLDIHQELAQRMYRYRYEYKNPEDFCKLLKTKELTYTRISRCLLHLLLEIKKEDMKYYKTKNYCPYTRLLGFRKSSTDLLHAIKENSSIPIITKNAKAASLLPQRDFTLFEQEITSCHLYEMVKSQKYQKEFQNEYTKGPIVLPL